MKEEFRTHINNMKTFFLCALAVCVLAGLASAEPLIYTFEGTVSSFFYDGAGIIAREGYRVGDRVTAKFVVDFARQGYYVLNNGQTLLFIV